MGTPFERSKLRFRWTNCIVGFDLPLNIAVDGKTFQWIYPTTAWQILSIAKADPKHLLVDQNYYIKAVAQQTFKLGNINHDKGIDPIQQIQLHL